MDVKHHGSPVRDVDRWLEAALHARNHAEPRMGLEDRVLARLSSAGERTSFLRWPLFAAFAAVLAIASALLVLHERHTGAETARELPAKNAQPATQLPVHRANIPPMTVEVQRRPRTRHASSCCLVAKKRTDAQEVLPRLARFPSARPQTAQERMLMRLAARHDSYETAALETHPEFSEVSVPELKVDRMAGTPPDKNPQR